MGSNVHVIPDQGRWALELEGGSPLGVGYRTQEDAVRAGREIARQNHSELLIHGKDGRIRDRDSTVTTRET